MRVEAASRPRFTSAFLAFLGGVGMLVVLRFLAGSVRFPLSIVPALNVLLAVLFLAIPILAIAQAARAPWKPAHAFGLVALGVVLQGLAIFAASRLTGLAQLAAVALGQGALQIWCVGLGAVVATLIRERNILIPIAIFLAVFDLFLVLTPIGITRRVMQAAPQILSSVGHAVPRVLPPQRPNEPVAPAEVTAYVGPADLVFLGAYFIALARFGMRLRETVRWMIPTLALYLAFVLGTGIALPALLPIGIVTLLVNRKEFRLSRDEWMSTAVVVTLGLGLLAFGATRPREAPAGPSNRPAAGARPAPLSTPAPGAADPRPSSAPRAR